MPQSVSSHVVGEEALQEVRARVLRLGADEKILKELWKDDAITVLDPIESQVRELVKLRRPGYEFSEEELTLAVRARLGENPDAYGCWAYYPWKKTIVHILDEPEFREVRTNRNMHKITADEQFTLAKKKVGVIGMSVGSGIALSLAMERVGGEIRIADFDTLELSNLNRIRTGVMNLTLSKTTIVAREIAEIDPFIEVKVFNEGITESNIEAFLEEDGGLDLLLEECDSFKIKLLARWEARKRRIPVIMDTSDRGLIDVERYDLTPNQGILHGRFTDEEVRSVIEEGAWKPEWIYRFISEDEMSDRMKVSFNEMNKTISRWPQLGSEVTMGAGVAVQLARMILLGDDSIEGRKFIDAHGIFLDKE